MKNALLILLIIIFPAPLLSQDVKAEKAQSQAEVFSAQGGTLMQREFVDIGKVKSLEVKVMKLTDLLTQKTVNALRFEYDYVASYGTDTKIAVIDKDEVAALESSLSILKATVMVTTKANYTEVSFTSRSGFEAGCFNEADKAEWSPYVKVEKHDSKSYVFMKADDIDALLLLIQTARAQL